nr:MAG TPA: helix-turn-helix domain protein [Caudoviricetes sp.]
MQANAGKCWQMLASVSKRIAQREKRKFPLFPLSSSSPCIPRIILPPIIPLKKRERATFCAQERRGDDMAARLTDRQKKKILADYVQTNNYCATAKINGVSATTVKNLVRANADIVKKCEQKKEENTADVMEYMNDHKDLVCSFIGKGLEMLNDPEKLAAANLSQITTAMGTLIDKWAMIGGSPADTVKEDALSQSLKEMAKELESDD